MHLRADKHVFGQSIDSSSGKCHHNSDLFCGIVSVVLDNVDFLAEFQGSGIKDDSRREFD